MEVAPAATRMFNSTPASTQPKSLRFHDPCCPSCLQEYNAWSKKKPNVNVKTASKTQRMRKLSPLRGLKPRKLVR